MSYPRTPTTTTSAATTTPNATPNEHYDASPATLTVSATPSASTPSKPHNSPNAASLTAIFDAGASRVARDNVVCDYMIGATEESTVEKCTVWSRFCNANDTMSRMFQMNIRNDETRRSMKAVVYSAPEIFTIREVPDPVPARGEVVIL